MVVTLYLYLLMAARGRSVRRYPLTHTGSDVAAGYFCVPTVSSWIIQAGGAGAYGQKANGAGKMAGNGAAAVGGAVGGSVAGRIKKMF